MAAGTAGGTTTEPRAASVLPELSVRTRITVAVAILVGLALTGAGLLVYALESAHIDQAVRDQVEQELAEFGQLRGGDDPDTGRPFTDVTRLIDLFLARNVPDDDELLVGYWNNAVQVRSGGLRHVSILDNPDFLRVIEARRSTGGSQSIDTDLGEVLVTVQPVRDSATSGAFVIASFLRDEHTELNRVMSTYAIVSLLSLGLVTAVAAWPAGRLLRPLRTLRETAQEISETDLSRRIPETGNDDITALTRTLNEMLARLEVAFTGQRDFLDDAGDTVGGPGHLPEGMAGRHQ